MSDRMRPAWARDSVVLRLDQPGPTWEMTPEWAFAGATGAGVRVAVVDSGVDADHPQLGDCVMVDDAVDFSVSSDGEIVQTHGPHGDVFGHGTAVAGIIHALAPEAMVTSVRVLGPALSGKAAAFHAGLEWAVEQGFDVINLSLGTTRSEWALRFHEVCDRAYFGNSFVVTAANNVQRASYPSLFASVASVACNTSDNPLRFHANPDPPTEFLARGIDIEVPWIDGGTTTTTGNSFAAPHIAAFATLVKSKHPELRPFQIKAALWATAANVVESSAIEPAGRRTTMFLAGSSTKGTAGTAGATTMLGEYQLTTVEHESRWGTQWNATRSVDSRPVAIHQIGDSQREMASAATALRTTLARIDALAHPHVDPLLEVLDRPHLAVVSEATMERFDNAGPQPVVQGLAIALAAGSALEAVHGLGIIHGDLDVSALVRGRSGVIVRRFGLGTALGDPAADNPALLDAHRMGHLAPEQLESRPATESCDVYALGASLYRLVVGRAAYPDDVAIGRYLRSRLTTDAISANDIAPQVPLAVSAVLTRAMHRDPQQRPASAYELGRELVAAAELTVGMAAVLDTGLVAEASISEWMVG